MSDETVEIETPVAVESLASKMLGTLAAAEPAKEIEKPVEVKGADPIDDSNIADADSSDDGDDEEQEEGESKETKPKKNADDEDDDEPDPALVASLKKHGVALDLTDIPKEAHKAIVQKVKAMEKGYTKAMQDARAYRAEKAEYDADKEYAAKQTDKYIVDMISKDPTMLEKVNAELKKREDPTYSEALEMQRQAAKDRAAADAQAHAQEQADHDAQIETLDAYVVSAVKDAKVPMTLVKEAIQLATIAKRDAGKGLITEAEIDEVVKAKAQVYHRGLSGAKGAEKRKYVEEKVADKAKNQNAKKPSGNVTTPVTKADGKPLSLREKMLATLDAAGV